jgi:hypothetical protein
VYKRQETHLAQCACAPQPCPHDGCPVTLPRGTLAEHLRSCQLRRVACPLAGCAAQVPCSHLWQHLAWPDPRHVRLLAQQYCALDKSLGDARLRAAEAALERHADALTPQHGEMERLRAQNSALRARLAAYEPEDEEPPPYDEQDDAPFGPGAGEYVGFVPTAPPQLFGEGDAGGQAAVRAGMRFGQGYS